MRHSMTICVLLAGCAARQPMSVASARDFVRRADRVEAFRLTQDPPRAGRGGQIERPPQREIAGPVSVDAASAGELSAILADDKSYGPFLPKCIPLPGVKLRFAREGTFADVYLCFECRILIVGREEADFSPAAGRLLAVIKRVFPEDSQIQALR